MIFCWSQDQQRRGVNIEAIGYPDALLRVSINTPKHCAWRTLDLKNRVIKNDILEVAEKGKGVGTNIILNQIESGFKLWFHSIKVTATGGSKMDYFNGHYTWGRLGFTMCNELDINEFKSLMLDSDRKEKELKDLLKTKRGRKFWMKNGFTWIGEFVLSQDSHNFKLLRKYLKSKKIKTSL